MSNGSTTPTAEDTGGRSTKGLQVRGIVPSGTYAPGEAFPIIPTPQVGDTVLLQIDAGVWRPLIVVRTDQGLVSGVVLCDPGDHTAPAFRQAYARVNSPTTISGRPNRSCPVGYADLVAYGMEPGQWRLK